MQTPTTGNARSDRSEGLVLYGADWCPDVRRSRALLEGMGVAYRYVDLEQDAEATTYVRGLQHGRRRIPTVVRSGGEHLVEPGDDELRDFLRGTPPDCISPAPGAA